MSRAEHLLFFSKFIEAEVGIVYSESNDFQLERRLEDTAKKHGFKGVLDLYQHARSNFDSNLKQTIRDLATNNETYFFRDPKVFDGLKSTILPEILERASIEKRKARIWTMACSYGQEPYSIAFQCKDLVDSRSSRWLHPEILATDIATHAIEKASNGIYTQADVDRGLSLSQVQKYFIQEGSSFKVLPEIKRAVKFQNLNLLTDSFSLLGKFDLILCRNILIYQSVTNKAEVLRKIKQNLDTAGYLLLGAGETLIGLPEQLESVKVDGALLYVHNAAIHKNLKSA